MRLLQLFNTMQLSKNSPPKWEIFVGRYIMVGVTGVEPVTSSLSGMRSNQLSYTPPFLKNGGGKRDRTDDLLNANQALSQLSYTPNWILLVRITHKASLQKWCGLLAKKLLVIVSYYHIPKDVTLGPILQSAFSLERR